MTPFAPLTTLRIGVLTVDYGGERYELEVRIVRDAAGGFRTLSGGGLSEPLASLELAMAHAATPEPSRDMTYSFSWRDGLQALVDERACPICAMPVVFVPRYPRRLCVACGLEAADKNGRWLVFGNLDFSGGFEARYRDDKSPYAGHDCFVRGRLCRADEARFGGIVVQLAEP